MPDTDQDVSFDTEELTGLALQCERVRDRRVVFVALLAPPTWFAGLVLWRRRFGSRID